MKQKNKNCTQTGSRRKIKWTFSDYALKKATVEASVHTKDKRLRPRQTRWHTISGAYSCLENSKIS